VVGLSISRSNHRRLAAAVTPLPPGPMAPILPCFACSKPSSDKGAAGFIQRRAVARTGRRGRALTKSRGADPCLLSPLSPRFVEASRLLIVSAPEPGPERSMEPLISIVDDDDPVREALRAHSDRHGLETSVFAFGQQLSGLYQLPLDGVPARRC